MKTRRFGVVAAPERRHQPFPLTDLQQGYWVGEHGGFELGKVCAHRYVEYEIQDLDVERLEEALRTVVRRHEMLRAIVLPDGQQQILANVPDYKVDVTDLRGQPPAAAQAALDEVRQRMTDEGAPSNRWPLFEVRVTRVDERTSRLHLSTNLIIHDGLSLKLMLDDLYRFYEDPDLVLPKIQLSFRDYHLTLENERASEFTKQSLEYWRARLATLPPAPELPLAKNPSSVQKTRFRRWTARLEPDLWQRFKARCMKSYLTASSAICTAYAEVIAMWSKNQRFTLNFLSGNRERLHPDVKKVVGPFSTTVLVEVDAATPGTFEARAKRLQDQLSEDVANSQVSGVQVVREAARQQGWGSRAVMPIVFANVLYSEMGDKEATLVPWKKIYHSVQTPQVYVDHQVREEEGALVLNWDCVPEIFPDGLLDDMFASYSGLIRRLATDEAAWKDADLRRTLVPRRHLELQAAKNATEAPVPDQLLHAGFVAQAAEHPERVAVVSPGKRLTYGELDRRSSQVASWVRRMGSGKANKLVGVVMDKGWEQVVACIGILKAGAAYLPIDPSFPKERIAYILEHAEASLVLTQSWLDEASRWPASVKRARVDDDSLASEDGKAHASIQKPGDIAYVIYTSGSTGMPKGVVIDHRGAVNTCVDLNERFSITPEDRVLALSALNFDLSVYDMFGMLAAGAAVVYPRANGLRDPAHWAELIQSERVTIWNTVPALMEMLVEHHAARGGPRPDSLRLVMMSGDWIPITLPARIRALLPKARLMSLGGATEASIWSILYPIDKIDPDWKSVPYGHAMKNQKFYVLNDSLDPCPTWVPGMLYIAGVGLAKGYYRDEAKTNAAFFDHPRSGERLYRTGDWGRFLPDGEIEFLGREDAQVKVRGFRIELGEIEVALRSAPGVKDAVVIARESGQGSDGGGNRALAGSPRGEKVLVAYVVGPGLSVEEVRAHLRGRLPDYMVPSAIVHLEAIPLSPNGKVDRKQLPAPDASRRTERVSRPPRDEIEKKLVAIWEEILGTQTIGVKEDFFELGGHSLLGLRLMARIHDAFGKDLSLAALFEGATIEHLAQKIRQDSGPAHATPLVPINAHGTKAPFFCVHPSGGNVLCYMELSKQLGADQPFYGLQNAGERELSLEAMALEYLSAIRAVQPRGPYRLGGWSFGGVVAFEIAHQLRAQGEKVAALVLIDSWPSTHAIEPGDDLEVLSRFARDLGGWRTRLDVSSPEMAKLSQEDRVKTVLEKMRAAGVVPQEMTQRIFRPLLETFGRNLRTGTGYRPKRYEGELALIRTREQPFPDFPDPARLPSYGWDALAKRVDVSALPGNHYSLLTEQVAEVAQLVARALKGTA